MTFFFVLLEGRLDWIRRVCVYWSMVKGGRPASNAV